METLLTPSVLPKLSNRFMDTLLTPADGADNRTDGPVKAKENGASTNIARRMLGALRSALGAFADMSPGGNQRTVSFLCHSLRLTSGATHEVRP